MAVRMSGWSGPSLRLAEPSPSSNSGDRLGQPTRGLIGQGEVVHVDERVGVVGALPGLLEPKHLLEQRDRLGDPAGLAIGQGEVAHGTDGGEVVAVRPSPCGAGGPPRAAGSPRGSGRRRGRPWRDGPWRRGYRGGRDRGAGSGRRGPSTSNSSASPYRPRWPIAWPACARASTPRPNPAPTVAARARRRPASAARSDRRRPGRDRCLAIVRRTAASTSGWPRNRSPTRPRPGRAPPAA